MNKNSRIKLTNNATVFLRHIFLIIISVVALFPIYLLFANSFKKPIEYSINKLNIQFPFSFENLKTIFLKSDLLIWLKNSFIITAISVLICTFIALFAAYGFSKLKIKGKEILFNILIGLMIFPPIILLIPLFIMMSRIGLLNSLISPIIIYIGLMMPFTIYMLTNFFRIIPDELIQAAKLDGCNDFQILRYVIIPLSGAAIAAVGVVNFFWVWNEFLIALVFLQDESIKTIQVGMTIFQSQYSMNTPLMLMGALISSIPVLILYIFTQRFFIKGIIMGSIKQ